MIFPCVIGFNSKSFLFGAYFKPWLIIGQVRELLNANLLLY